MEDLGNDTLRPKVSPPEKTANNAAAEGESTPPDEEVDKFTRLLEGVDLGGEQGRN